MTEEMDEEEGFLVTPDESEEGEESAIQNWRARQHKKLQGKNQSTIDKFLGRGSRHYVTGIMPGYYGELLIWALLQYLKRTGWKIVDTLGYREPEPVYADVNTGSETMNLLVSGQILVEKDKDRYSITVAVNPILRGSVQMEGSAEKKEGMSQFIADVLTIADVENFYRGKKLEFSGRIRFLDIGHKTWDTIVLDAETKAEIKANSIGFLRQEERWMQFGIPVKRGILLCGEPGTGKTVICKALMSEAEDITCIITNAYALAEGGYITQLYELADDLSPCIVFIEDIDLIGQSRTESGYHHGPALIDLLAELDGVEEQEKIVTIATTNLLETLDKALSQRPSRFDKVIKLTRPSVQYRRELISLLCRKIPMEKNIQEYLAIKAENCTPAQLQEIIFGLTIQQPPGQSELVFTKADIDRAISNINDKSRHQIGFVIDDNHNGHKLEQITDIGG
jgi:cell division protease FtsH